MLSFFLYYLKFDLGQSLAQGHFHNERNIFTHFYTFSNRTKHFQTESNIFTLFHIQRRPKCYSDILRTPSPMLSHQLHCQDYRDNVYIFMYTLYLYALCISRPDTPNAVPFQCTPLWPDLLIRLIPLYVYVLSIRLMLLPLQPAPLTPYTYTFNLYILRIRNTYTYYIYFILTYNTYIFYLQFKCRISLFFL